MRGMSWWHVPQWLPCGAIPKVHSLFPLTPEFPPSSDQHFLWKICLVHRGNKWGRSSHWGLRDWCCRPTTANRYLVQNKSQIMLKTGWGFLSCCSPAIHWAWRLRITSAVLEVNTLQNWIVTVVILLDLKIYRLGKVKMKVLASFFEKQFHL